MPPPNVRFHGGVLSDVLTRRSGGFGVTASALGISFLPPVLRTPFRGGIPTAAAASSSILPVLSFQQPRFIQQQNRSFANCYSNNLRRNHIPFTDFETGFPKRPQPSPTVLSAFTLSKQRKLTRLLAGEPQKTFRGRVVHQLSVLRVNHSGRNNLGRITTRYRQGGTRQRLRLVDFKRGRKDIYCTVMRIEYSPERSAFVALVQYEDGVLSYILAPLAVWGVRG